MVRGMICAENTAQKKKEQEETRMNIPENIFSTLTDEQKQKVKAAKTPEELLSLAKEAGYELNLEQLEGVAGGWCGGHCYVMYD